MTFNTTKNNTFKKSNLKGLEYKQIEPKPVPFVQIVGIMFAILIAVTCVKMCFDKPEVVTVEQLNADRR